MGGGDDSSRLIAACTDCGALYAATELADGSILPIGQRDGCQCGCTAFAPVDEGLPGPGDDEHEGDGEPADG